MIIIDRIVTLNLFRGSTILYSYIEPHIKSSANMIARNKKILHPPQYVPYGIFDSLVGYIYIWLQ